MARKDDPVFNVKFVQLVENQPCLWNYTHPGYSKKDEVQKAWQHVANDIKDTVRNSRERWRTIRSSFLRSLKLTRTQTGRGKRKYYLSKYLQFLIPYTKSRACHKQQMPQQQEQQEQQPNPQAQTNPNPNLGMVLRKPSTSTAATAAATYLTPMTRMRLMEQHHPNTHTPRSPSDEDTKDSITSPTDVHLSGRQQDRVGAETPPLRLQAIKVEPDKMIAAQQLVTLPVSMAAAALRNNMDWTVAEWLKGNNNNNHQLQYHNNNNNNMLSHAATPPPPAATPVAAPPAAPPTPALTLTAGQTTTLDADYSFLISLHPYLREMTSKQSRRFRQKVVALIDSILDNVDTA